MKEFLKAIRPLFPVTYDSDKLFKLNFQSNAELFTMLIKMGIYLLVGVVVGVVLGILGAILPFLGVVWWIVGTLCELYVVAGIVLELLIFLKIIEA